MLDWSKIGLLWKMGFSLNWTKITLKRNVADKWMKYILQICNFFAISRLCFLVTDVNRDVLKCQEWKNDLSKTFLFWGCFTLSISLTSFLSNVCFSSRQKFSRAVEVYWRGGCGKEVCFWRNYSSWVFTFSLWLLPSFSTVLANVGRHWGILNMQNNYTGLGKPSMID